MQITDISLDNIDAARWNANEMDPDMRERLRHSIERFGMVVPLVVRPLGDDRFETIGGAQRLEVARTLGLSTVPCVMVQADEGQARLLSLCLNRIEGQDNLGLKAEMIRTILASLPQDELLSLLPETGESLEALGALGQEGIADSLVAWQRAQQARLRHLTFQLSGSQLEVVSEALEKAMAGVTKTAENPNRRGLALFYLCRDYLKLKGGV